MADIMKLEVDSKYEMIDHKFSKPKGNERLVGTTVKKRVHHVYMYCKEADERSSHTDRQTWWY